jgi:membrane protein DedA with SNARE-associated domain
VAPVHPLLLAGITDKVVEPIAGFSVSEGDLTLFGVVTAGVLGNLVGSWIAYAVGYYERLDLLEKNKLIHVSPKHLKWADDWFAHYGAATVFFSRMLPIVRTFISLPAGVARMPFWRFSAYTLAGCIPWVLMLALVGQSVGDNWEEWRHKLGYLDYVVLAAIVSGVVYLIVKRRRNSIPPPAGAGGGM